MMLAKTEDDLKGIMKRFKKYIERKSFTLSTEKSKVLVYEKGRGRI